MYKYQAFGFIIESPYPVIQVETAPNDTVPDIIVQKSDLTDLSSMQDDEYKVTKEAICFNYPRAGLFRITNGSLIEIKRCKDCTDEIFSVYLMGSCMGAIFHQKNLLPIHGSCVTDGKHSIIISGHSGTGKSTLASEFLRNGWKLVTDDVSLIKNISETPAVQSSYPSQKLWQDSLSLYESENRLSQPLYQMENREKFGVAIKDSFHKGTVPLTLFVQLYVADSETAVTTIDGFNRVDRLVHNTYRKYFICPDNRNRFFQDCVTLSQKIQMIQAIRQEGHPTQELLFKKITDYLND